MCKGEDQGELDLRIIPAFSMAENSAWADANFSGSRRRALAKTGGPGCVRRWCLTPWRGLEAVKPSEDATSGNSERRSAMHLGVARRLALGGDATGSGEVGSTMVGEVGESALKTLWLATSRRRLKWLKKSAPRIGIATGASWKGHLKLCLPKRRGINRVPEQGRAEPSAVRRFTPDLEDEGGAGKTDTDAPESIRNLLELRESCR